MNISKELESILSRALEEALRTGCEVAEAGHLMLGILRTKQCGPREVLGKMGLDLSAYKEILDSCLSTPEELKMKPEDVTLAPRAENILGMTILEATMSGFSKAYGIHLLLALLRDGDATVCSLLSEEGITLESVRKFMMSEGYLEKKPRNISEAPVISNYITVFHNSDKPVS